MPFSVVQGRLDWSWDWRQAAGDLGLPGLRRLGGHPPVQRDLETMAASAGTVYAVVRRGADSELFSSPASRDAWARAGTMTGSNLAVFGKAAWFGTSTAGTSTYLWATADGVHWRKYPFSCPTAPAHLGLGGIAAASSWQVAFLCGVSEGTYHSAKEVLLSVNGGRTEHLTGQAPVAGDVAGFAVPPSRAAVITIAVVTPGLDYVYGPGDRAGGA